MLTSILTYGGGGCTNATNDNFSSAISLTIGAGAIGGTTCGGTIETSENLGCNQTTDQTVWYSFVATSTTSYVTVTTTGSCYVGVSIHQAVTLPTSFCSIQSCQAAASGPTVSIHQLVTIIGQTYKVQITYNSGGACGNEGTFTINVANTCVACVINNPPPPNTCSTASSGCYFTSPPSVATVTSTCPSYPLTSGVNNVNSGWYYFTTPLTNAITLNFQNIISSTCGGGNVAWWIWKLYDNSCNPIACGNLSSLNYQNTGCNITYRLEYMWEQLSCSYTIQYPFQYTDGTAGCFPLPIKLISFTGEQYGGVNKIKWSTVSEINNNYFTIEKSNDGFMFYEFGKVYVNKNSYEEKSYSILDEKPLKPTTYYRLKQIDFNGQYEYSDIIVISKSDDNQIKLEKITNIMGQEVNDSYEGIKIYFFNNGSVIKN